MNSTNRLSLPLVNQDYSAQALSPQSPKSPSDFDRTIELSSEFHSQSTSSISCLEETDHAPENLPDESKDTLEPKPVDNETDSLGLKVVKLLKAKGKLGCVPRRYCPLYYIKRHIEYCIRIKVEEGLGKDLDIYFRYLSGSFMKVKAKWNNSDSHETMSFDRFNKST